MAPLVGFQHLRKGQHRLRIETAKVAEGARDNFFCVEGVLLTSSTDEIDSRRAWIVKLLPGRTFGLSLIKTFVLAATDLAEDDLAHDVRCARIMKVIVDDNPLRDLEMDVECVEVELSKAQRYLRVLWKRALRPRTDEDRRLQRFRVGNSWYVEDVCGRCGQAEKKCSCVEYRLRRAVHEDCARHVELARECGDCRVGGAP